MHAGGGTNDRGEKRNVLIVSILLPIGGDLYAVQQYAEARLCPEDVRGVAAALVSVDPWPPLTQKTITR